MSRVHLGFSDVTVDEVFVVVVDVVAVVVVVGDGVRGSAVVESVPVVVVVIVGAGS